MIKRKYFGNKGGCESGLLKEMSILVFFFIVVPMREGEKASFSVWIMKGFV